MKNTIGFFLLASVIAATPALAAPCKVGSNVGGFVDDVLTDDTLQQVKSDKEVFTDAESSIVAVLEGDECVKFVFGKKRRAELAKAIIETKLAKGPKSPAKAVIDAFLATAPN